MCQNIVSYIIVKMFVNPAPNIHGEGTLSLREIYNRSKKNDDYLTRSSAYTYLLIYELKRYQFYFRTKKVKEEVFRLICIGIKVAFLLNPTEEEIEYALSELKDMLSQRDQEFKQAFRKWVDNEVLEYKNPDEDQAKLIKSLIELMKLA